MPKLFSKYAPSDKPYSVFMCGPEAMYRFAEKELEKLGLDRKHIRRELLGVTKKIWEKTDYPTENKGKTFSDVIRQGSEEHTIPVSADETVLAAIERAGIAAPSRCRSGECGWCRSKLIDGNVYVPAENDEDRRASDKIYDTEGGVHELHNVKLDALEELLEEAGGDSVLVLYAYKHDAERIKRRVTCRALDTPEDIDAWNRGDIPVALAHPASIGHGLNLQDGGHIIVWFGLTWSLKLYQQANERLNRPGQKNVCRIYHLMLKGTHDERVLKALQNKDRGQAAAIEALRLKIAKEMSK